MIKIFLVLLYLILQIHLFSIDNKKNDLLMGSIVKSDEWEIDTKKNIEYFRKNVYFKNYYYIMKSDYAVYDRVIKVWNTKGNVYFKRNFDDGNFIEMYCDNANYDEKKELTRLSSDNRIRMIYYDNSKFEKYFAYSKNILADNNCKKIFFNENFELIISSISAFSNYCVYDDIRKTFELTEKPYSIGYNNDYKVYLQGEKITINKNDLKILVEEKVFGVIRKK